MDNAMDSKWVEKYRPTSISNVLLPRNLKTFFNNLIKKGNIPNMLFYSSSPGVGKTSVGKALCNDLDIDNIYFNASKIGIDALRERVVKFSRTKSLSGNKKAIIMDEIDGLKAHVQRAMRADVEEYVHTGFICTANYMSQIIKPLKSRFQLIDFNYTTEACKKELGPKIKKRLINILKNESIDFNEETIDKMVSVYYPDIRNMINIMEKYSNMHGIIDDNIFSFSCLEDEFYEYILNRKLTKARQYLMDSGFDYSELYTMLFRNLVPRMDKQKQGQAILIIAEYMHRDANVIDKEINATACMLEIISNL